MNTMHRHAWLPVTLSMILCAACSSSAPPPSTPVAAAATAPPAQGSPPPTDAAGARRIQGRDYSVPLPSGFVSVGDPSTPGELRTQLQPLLDQGAVALFSEKTPPGWFRGSVVVTPVDGDVPTGAEACKGQAAEVARMTKSKLLEARLMASGGCRWAVQDGERETRGAIGAVMKGTGGHWVVTCNLDTRDDASRAACEEVLAGWRAGR